MKKTLTTNEINNIVVDTIEKMDVKKGTAKAPFVQMDFSIYTSDTLDAIKTAFVAAGIRFEDRWGDGSDFIVPIDVKCVPPTFRGGRRDTFCTSDGPICKLGDAKKPLNLGRRDTFAKSDGSICEPGQAKKPHNLGRRDVFTKSDGPICVPGQVKKESLDNQIKNATKLVKNGIPKKTQERTL